MITLRLKRMLPNSIKRDDSTPHRGRAARRPRLARREIVCAYALTQAARLRASSGRHVPGGSKRPWYLDTTRTHGRKTRGRNRSANFRLRQAVGMLVRVRHAVRPRLRCSGNLRYVVGQLSSLFVRVAGMPNGSGRMEHAAQKSGKGAKRFIAASFVLRDQTICGDRTSKTVYATMASRRGRHYSGGYHRLSGRPARGSRSRRGKSALRRWCSRSRRRLARTGRL